MKTLNRLIYGGAAVALALTFHCNNSDNNGTGGNGHDMTTTNPGGGDGGTGGGGDGGTGGGGDGGTGGGDMSTGPGTTTLTAISPSNGPTTGGTTLTLTGANIPSDAQVYIDNLQATVTGTPTSTQIVVTTPPDQGKKGKVNVEIRRPATGVVASNANLFSYYYGTVTFALPTTSTFAVGTNPSAIVLANVNANPSLDAVVTNYADNSVSVLSGNGDGTFSSVGTYLNAPSGFVTRPSGLAIADFNKDNIPDVATSNTSSEDVSILINSGTGVLTYNATRAMLPSGAAPNGIAAGKLGADTIPSVVTANFGTNDVSLLKGTGLSTLNTPMSYVTDPSATARPSQVVLADMDKDGSLDIVVSNNSTATIGVLLAKNAFIKQVYATGASGPHGLVVGDFNGDGWPDVATTLDNNAPTIAVLLGTSAAPGTLLMQHQYPAGKNNADTPAGLAAGDLNGDGLDDLVVTEYGSDFLSILLAQQGGSFASPTFNQIGKNPKAVAIGDLNGDGRPDLAAVNYTDGNVSVLLNNAK